MWSMSCRTKQSGEGVKCLSASETPWRICFKAPIRGELDPIKNEEEPALKRSPRMNGAEPVWLSTTKVYWMPWAWWYFLVLFLVRICLSNLKERMHLPEKSCQMCLSVPEGQENGNSGSWKATSGRKGSSKRKLALPHQILWCQIKWFVQVGCVRLLVWGHHRGWAERRCRVELGDSAWMQEKDKGRYCEDKSGCKQDKPTSPQSIKAVLGHPQPVSQVLHCLH